MNQPLGGIEVADCASIRVARYGNAQQRCGTDQTMLTLPTMLRRKASVLHTTAGDVLFEPSWLASTQYQVINGIVSLKQLVFGVDITLQSATSGDWLSLPLEPGRPSGTRAICATASTLLSVPTRSLCDSLVLDARFALCWRQETARQLVKLQQHVVRLRLPRASDRIAHYLIHESVNGCGELSLPFSNGVWAELLNLAPETLSRALGEMAHSGRLERQGYRHLRLIQPPPSDT